MKNYNIYILIGIITTILLSCNTSLSEVNNEYPMPEEQNSVSDSKSDFVNKQLAQKIANNVLQGQSRSTPRVVSSVRLIEKENTPLFYIINYENGGFVIISATKKYYPVLAYSESNSFPSEIKIGYWFNNVTQKILNAKSLDTEKQKEINLLWSTMTLGELEETSARSTNNETMAFVTRLNELRNTHPDYQFIRLSQCTPDLFAYNGNEIYTQMRERAQQYGSPEEYTIVGIKTTYASNIVGPLLQTQWQQGGEFNNKCPNDYPAGCVAIAMAQIMKFHEHPSSYNWSNMPNTMATSDTQTLIADIGNAVEMDYGADGSGSNINKARNAFINDFDYETTKESHNHNRVKSEILNNRRPVYMRGSDNQFLFFDWDGHAWICDGVNNYTNTSFYFAEYRFSTSNGYYYSSPEGPSALMPYEYGYSALYFHMNWGWGGSYDGWFNYDTAQPAEGLDNYEHNRENLYIYPKN